MRRKDQYLTDLRCCRCAEIVSEDRRRVDSHVDGGQEIKGGLEMREYRNMEGLVGNGPTNVYRHQRSKEGAPNEVF